MKCNFMWHSIKMSLFQDSAAGFGYYVELMIFLDNMVVLKILKIDHIDCEKFMFIYQQNSSHLGNSSLHYVSHLGSMIFQ